MCIRDSNNSQSFIPIYELVTDPTKKQTLKAYIDNYIKRKEVCSISPVSYTHLDVYKRQIAITRIFFINAGV